MYAAEVIIAISLLLGLFTRIGGVLGALMGINLWLGLYRAPYEWPWAYFFLILLQITFIVYSAGRSLGLDAVLTSSWAACTQADRVPGASPDMAHLEGRMRHDPAKD